MSIKSWLKGKSIWMILCLFFFICPMDVYAQSYFYSSPPAGSGSGSVTSFSSGNLSPLFTTNVATATTTPALTFTPATPAAFTLFGNNTGSAAAASFISMDTLFGTCSGAANALTFNTTTHAFGCNTISGGGGTPGGADTSVQYNNGGAFGGFGTWDGSTFAIPNAASNGITFSNANGRVTGSGGGYLNFDGNGSPSLTAGGTNQPITLTPSGTGNVNLTGNLVWPGLSNGGFDITSTAIAIKPHGTTGLTVGTGGISAGTNFAYLPRTASCSGTTCNLDFRNGNTYWITLTADTTAETITPPLNGGRVVFIWIQGATPYTVTNLPTTVWHGITAPGTNANSWTRQECDYTTTGTMAVCGVANTNIP